MPPRRFSDSDYAFIEEVSQQRAKFFRIRRAQSEAFRSNMPEYEAALAQFLQKTTGIHAGKNWEPPPDKVDEYINECEKICQREINSMDDRIIIYYAAHGASACLILRKMGSRKEAVQLAIIRRTKELLDKSKPPAPPWNPQILEPTNTTIPAASSSRARPLSAHEVEEFMKNFGLFEEKRFILNSDAPDDVAIYEVITQFRKTGEYEILFEDSEDDPIKVCKDELRKMLKDSRILA